VFQFKAADAFELVQSVISKRIVRKNSTCKTGDHYIPSNSKPRGSFREASNPFDPTKENTLAIVNLFWMAMSGGVCQHSAPGQILSFAASVTKRLTFSAQ